MMVRVGRRSFSSSGFADSDDDDEVEDGVDDRDLVDLDDKTKILSSYGIGISMRPRSGSSPSGTEDVLFTDLNTEEVEPRLVRCSADAVVSIIDHKMQEHVGKMLNLVESLNVRLAKMDMKSSQLESSVDQLNESVEWCHGRSHEKLRQLEDILQEVHGTVRDLKDKYEIAETQIKLSKLQLGKNHPPSPTQGTAVKRMVDEISTVAARHPNQLACSPNVAPQVLPVGGYNMQSKVALENQKLPASAQTSIQLPQNNAIPMPLAPYGHQLSNPDTAHGQMMPPYQEFQPRLYVPQQLHYPVFDLTRSSQLHSHASTGDPYQHVSVNYAEGLKVQPQGCHNGPYFSQLPNWEDPRQFYRDGSTSAYPAMDSWNLPFPDEQGTAVRKHNADNLYLYNDWRISDSETLGTIQTSKSGNRFSGHTTEAAECSIPRALPMASYIDDDELSTVRGEHRAEAEESDVVNKVSGMGFRRDIVKATVKKLKENGEPVNLNAILDKLMNEG